MRATGGGRDTGPQHGAGGDVDGWPDLSEDHVGGKLHQDVADVEDGHSNVELVADETKVRLEGVELGLTAVVGTVLVDVIRCEVAAVLTRCCCGPCN